MSDDVQKAQAILYGLALGDALGWPVEFLKMRKINIIYDEEGIKEPPDPARYTDETQMTLAVSEALITAGEQSIDALMEVVTGRFIAWSNSPDNDRAPGHTVTEAIRTLEAGVSWRESGVAHAEGNGSAVRVAPIGYLYQHDLDRLRDVAHAIGIATHAHPTADAASVAGAVAIKLALDGVHPENYVEYLIDSVQNISREFVDVLSKVEHVIHWTDEQAALEYIGSGWVGKEVIPMAIYCAARYPDDFVGAVRRAVNIPGDSDSVGCVTGGLVAARLGLEGIPTEWIDRLENREGISDAARRLAEKKQSLATI